MSHHFIMIHNTFQTKDIAVAGISVQASRREVVDFIKQHTQEENSLFLRHHRDNSMYFISVFRSTLWAMILASSIVAFIMYTTFDRILSNNTNIRDAASNLFYFCMALFGQGTYCPNNRANKYNMISAKASL